MNGILLFFGIFALLTPLDSEHRNSGVFVEPARRGAASAISGLPAGASSPASISLASVQSYNGVSNNVPVRTTVRNGLQGNTIGGSFHSRRFFMGS